MLDFVQLMPFKCILMENNEIKKPKILFLGGQVVNGGLCNENSTMVLNKLALFSGALLPLWWPGRCSDVM